MMHEQREALRLFLRDWNRMIGDDPSTLILEDAVRLYQECVDLLTGTELAEERFKSRKHEVEQKDAEVAYLRLGLEQIIKYIKQWADVSDGERTLDNVVAIAQKALETTP